MSLSSRSCVVQLVAPKGVDVVYDPVGGKSFEEALKVVKWGAQILIIGFASGAIPKVQLPLYFGICPDHCILEQHCLRSQGGCTGSKQAITAARLEHMWPTT